MTVFQPHVAILMATCNGARYVQEQVKSFARNEAKFSLHWIDDHSTDDTRNIVRSTAASLGIDLVERHQAGKLGVPGTFFQLLEEVEADIYLFSDQDDVWEQGKIDAVVANLTPDAGSPVLCYTDPLVFYADEPETFYRRSRLMKIEHGGTDHGSLCVNYTLAAGHSVAITKALRDLYLGHKDIARAHAAMHSNWLLLVANAAGTLRPLDAVPVTLFRQHGANVTGEIMKRRQGWKGLVRMWELQHMMRRYLSRQARGFILAAPTLPPGPKLDRELALAPLVATFRSRQSLRMLFQLWRHRSLLLGDRPVMWLLASCLLCDAKRAADKSAAARPVPAQPVSPQAMSQ